ncbi:hypothetical protein QBC37DRAFT_422297 [Rhypophila decipiens]|uniref:Uncharacterized protein n=1 Tax=Rhypophila decipiens TaxID=261697 RepID=A0AAN7BAF7_9PEZI|nr:hypothetical protein QBC37DRAFT_422297 [Rhypophila decipiens]
MSSVPSSPNSRVASNPTNNPQQIPKSKFASKAVGAPPGRRRPQRLPRLEISSSSSTGADINHTGATKTTLLPAIAVAPSPPGPVPDRRPMVSSTEEYRAKMREWHNDIGKKYRNKLNEKFEGLQAVLVHVASNVDMSLQGPASTSSGSPRGADDERDVVIWTGAAGSGSAVPLEVLRRMQQQEEEEELLGNHGVCDDEEGAEDEDDDDAEGPAARGGARIQPRRRQTRGINKARVLAMARRTIVKLAMERDQLLRELAEASEESE